jgi:hypothetical protein
MGREQTELTEKMLQEALQIPSLNEKQRIAGNLKESSRQMICSLLSLARLWIMDSVRYLKEKMIM